MRDVNLILCCFFSTFKIRTLPLKLPGTIVHVYRNCTPITLFQTFILTEKQGRTTYSRWQQIARSLLLEFRLQTTIVNNLLRQREHSYDG